MSFQAMTWAIGQQTRNAGQKLVLLMLANYCNAHTGQCNPSHKRLAAECSMGVSTLKTHIQGLAELGLLRVIHKQSEGVALPNQYLLNLGGVGQDLTEGGSESDGGVGQNLATNQELKPGTEPNTPQPPRGEPVGFQKFWASWPKTYRKGSKTACLKTWGRFGCEKESEAIIAHVKAMSKTEAWRKQGGEFVPAPLVYLNGRRWDGADVSEESPGLQLVGAI